MQLSQAVNQFLSGYFATRERSMKTQTAYKLDLSQFLKHAGFSTDLEAVSPENIEEWVSHLRSNEYSVASIRRKIVSVRVFFKYWVRRHVLSHSPFWKLQMSLGSPKLLPRSLSEHEIASLIAQASQNLAIYGYPKNGQVSKGFLALRNLALVDLLFSTGLRVGEVSTLSLDSYSAEEKIFTVHGKGKRQRLAVLVDAKSIKIQERYLRIRKSINTGDHSLFINVFRTRLSTQGISNIIKKLAFESNIQKHITPHMLRHTIATLLLRNGVDIRVVQEFLGHASITSTQRYTHVAKEQLISVLRRHHPSLAFRR